MQIIPVASGKGGVGKSLLSANLAIALGKAGKKVILADLDLGASNLHLVIGQQAPRAGIGTFLTGRSSFSDIIFPTDYQNVEFIPGDSEIPGLSTLKIQQKADLIRNLQQCDADYLILDLGAGTHLTILDFFLLSPQGILITTPTVTATLNGYLFLKNAVFRLMYNCFPKDSPAYRFLENIKTDASSLQRLYIPKLIESIRKVDPQNAAVFSKRIEKFKPRLVFNMIDDPKDAEKAHKIRRSCKEYLGLEIEHLGVIYRDAMQDAALSSRLPLIVYKPQSILSQGIFRIADRVLQSETVNFSKVMMSSEETFDAAAADALEDFDAKMSYIEELIGTGALTTSDLADTIKAQQYEITQLKKENNLLKSKLLAASAQGYRI